LNACWCFSSQAFDWKDAVWAVYSYYSWKSIHGHLDSLDGLEAALSALCKLAKIDAASCTVIHKKIGETKRIEVRLQLPGDQPAAWAPHHALSLDAGCCAG
jgi:hypothetical protein